MTLRNDDRLTRRPPLAAIENHPALDAAVADERERQALAVHGDRVTSRAGALRRRSSKTQLHLRSFDGPRPLHRGPALTCQRERAVATKLSGECAESERRVGNGYLLRVERIRRERERARQHPH